MANVIFDHIVKKYTNSDVPAIPDLSIDIKDKEFLVLVGPSGCGKSTALRMIAGLEDISDGNLYIGDRRVNDVAPKDRDIAMVFQSYALYPHMSVYDNMAFGLKLRKKPKAEISQRVREAAQILGITQFLDRKPKALSGGQRQRVALGRAIVREPKVFLMDEPLSNLDAKLRVQTRTEISKLHQRLQTTMIYVTHDQTEAMTMGDRIAVMKDGVLQQLDTPQTLYDHPVNMFVAGFIGSPSMNFFNVTIQQMDGAMYASNDLFKLRLPESQAQQLRQKISSANSIILGIRPEDIEDQQFVTSPQEGRSASVNVEVIEPMGYEVYVYFGSGAGIGNYVARVDNRTMVRPGNKVNMYFNVDKMHAFDPQTQNALY